MTSQGSATLAGGVELLERAINYTLGSLHLVTGDDLARSSPCAGWDLRALLWHLHDSLSALHEAVALGAVSVADDGSDPDTRTDVPRPCTYRAHASSGSSSATGDCLDPVAGLRDRASQVLGVWTRAETPELVSIGDVALTASMVTGTGALEVAVHGWDIAMTCGRPRDIPTGLAVELLQIAPALVTRADRPVRFAAPYAVPGPADPGSRLVAFLGRHPDRLAT